MLSGKHMVASSRVLALLSQKGGSGKTTLATHLAVALGAEPAPRRVTLIDTDPQALRRRLGPRQGRRAPSVVEALAAEITAALRAVRAAGADLVIIDTMPSVAADIAASPARPTWC